MYNVNLNNFYEREKNATVYTPKGVSEFLFDIVCCKINKDKTIIDPCVGAGSLLYPFQNAGYKVIGIDVDCQGFDGTVQRNFLAVKKDEFATPALVIANPPFNIDSKTKVLAAEISGVRPLLPEVWLQKIIQLWGRNVPICLFAPYGMRLNQSITSKRWQKFIDGTYPQINSIISLPKDIYENVLFHSEILIFNIDGLKGHYFYNSGY